MESSLAMTREQSANKIIFAKSSLLGKRPTNQLQPGEIGLNTNSQEPGLFFETTDGKVIKVGPTAVLPEAPTSTPERGETWLDTVKGTFNVGDATRSWRSIAAPFLGGDGNVVFVAPEFEFSSDAVANDGQALPYQTITRAVLELSKIYISNLLSGLSQKSESNRYTIFLVSSRFTANNGPGQNLADFSLDLSDYGSGNISLADLSKFNTTKGAIVIPAGISVVGLDLRKCVVCPSYVPSYRNHTYPTALAGVNQPITSIFKVSGNSFLSNFSVNDKINYIEVVGVTNYSTYALFKARRPHGLELNDLIDIQFSQGIDQSTGTFSAGKYYVIPLTTYTFQLSTEAQLPYQGAPNVPFVSMPSDINFQTVIFNCSITLKSAHRLRVIEEASKEDIAEYYTKVQKAFPVFFGGKVTDGDSLVSTSDYIIVGPTDVAYPGNLGSNTTKNSPSCIGQVDLRSDYGMCFSDFDGFNMLGFKSLVAKSCTSLSLQNDPTAYEIYTTLESEQKWWSLTEYTYLSKPLSERPASIVDVTVEDQLQKLNSVPISNIRYYYQNLRTSDGLSLGIVDTDTDFRHFGFRSKNGACADLQSVLTIGPAVGVWSLNGGFINLTNSTSNFGSVAFKAEGFLGINTAGGAQNNSQGFVFEGIYRPLALTIGQVENTGNKKILSLGSRIVSSYIDPTNTEIQIVELSADFDPRYLLPYSLKPGSAIWVETEECTYRGFLATDGELTVSTGQDDPSKFALLRIRSSDSTIPTDSNLIPVLGVPFIRRFNDCRRDVEKSYSMVLSSSSSNTVSPHVGDVLRLDQNNQTLGQSSLRPNVQFDPGILGGWGRIFTVNAVETGVAGSSPQFNYLIGDNNQDIKYYVTVTASDYDRPWVNYDQGNNSYLTFDNPSGSYTTYNNRNWYAAENNYWTSVYYGQASNFQPSSGPEKLAPTSTYSPFVDTSTLERQDTVSQTFQGTYATDEYSSVYPTSTYFRGSTNPYTTYPVNNQYDDDDGSESLGICIKDLVSDLETFLVSQPYIVQSGQLPGPTQRYRPEIVEFSVLSPGILQNPRQATSIVRIGNDSNHEFVRVICISGSIVKAIRLNLGNSFYYSTGVVPDPWPIQTSVRVCDTNPTPEPGQYDPNWSNTKRAILRFFQVMGYSQESLLPYLQPKFWGERLLSISSLPLTPGPEGYALTTDKWPMEFNTPSTIIANTHNWLYPGYFNFSRGLPKFQPSDISRKLAADFQATTLWSGRLTITGVNDRGETISFGSQRQALTANYFEQTNPSANLANQQIYEQQPFVEFPGQVTVYSADSISSLFNGSTTTFTLTKGGVPIPSTQIAANSIFAILGAVTQAPGKNYTVNGNQLTFSDAPLPNTVSDVRIITSDDNNRTLQMVPLKIKDGQSINGVSFSFTLVSKDPSISLASFDINANNTFVFLGGTEQLPLTTVGPLESYSYTITRVSSNEVEITFSEAPAVGTVFDVRAVCTSSFWATQSIYPVQVYSLNSISSQFDGVKTEFDLTYGYFDPGSSLPRPVNAASVSTQNILVSLGGSMQIPYFSGATQSDYSYKVEGSKIVFTEGPAAGSTMNIRAITNAEFLTCPSGKYGAASFQKWGPSLVLELADNASIIH
jgi:hypothetical protein